MGGASIMVFSASLAIYKALNQASAHYSAIPSRHKPAVRRANPARCIATILRIPSS